MASESMYASRNSANSGIPRGLVHQAVPGQVGEVTQALMAGVEQPQLHQLIRCDVLDHQHADFFERGSAVGEVVLEHPRRERLGDHRPLVLDVELRLPVRTMTSGVVTGVMRSTIEFGNLVCSAIHSARPGCDLLGVGGERLAGDVAVALDVVAGHDRRRGDAAFAATRQRFGDQAEDATDRRRFRSCSRPR